MSLLVQQVALLLVMLVLQDWERDVLFLALVLVWKMIYHGYMDYDEGDSNNHNNMDEAVGVGDYDDEEDY